jgi:hypothetical protein
VAAKVDILAEGSEEAGFAKRKAPEQEKGQKKKQSARLESEAAATTPAPGREGVGQEKG